MIIVASKYLIPKGYAAMAVYPFILLHSPRLKKQPLLLNHECIHLRQQAEMLILPFYVWYFTEYLLRLLVYKNHHAAYCNISFEREAYANEHHSDYLKKRKFWNFLNYL